MPWYFFDSLTPFSYRINNCFNGVKIIRPAVLRCSNRDPPNTPYLGKLYHLLVEAIDSRGHGLYAEFPLQGLGPGFTQLLASRGVGLKGR